MQWTPSSRLALALVALSFSPLAQAGGVQAAEPLDDGSTPAAKFGDAAATFRTVKEELLKNYYRDDLTEADLYRAAVQGMLTGADPALKAYNRLMSPSEYAELQVSLHGQVLGIGVVLNIIPETGVMDVLEVIPGSPAERAGIREGDRILTVDGKSFKGRKLQDVVGALRGKEGTSVSLQVLHEAQVLTRAIRRERVVWDSVQHQRYAGDIEVLTISSFSERTPEALRQTLSTIAASKPRGLVVDLRANEGGVLDQAIAVAKLLLPAGTPITQLVHRGQKVETLSADGQPVLSGVPAVVLVGGDTMSSAELLAAALRQGLHAPLIGSKTKGKWSVQALKELPNGYVMRYTVAVFRSPDGQSYEGAGLAPDIEVTMDQDALEQAEHLHDPTARLAADVQLRAAVNLLRIGGER